MSGFPAEVQVVQKKINTLSTESQTHTHSENILFGDFGVGLPVIKGAMKHELSVPHGKEQEECS